MTKSKLNWEDMRFIVKTADEMMEESEVEVDDKGYVINESVPNFMATEEAYYTELLKRFNQNRKTI